MLARHGQPAMRLVPVVQKIDLEARGRLIEAIMVYGARNVTPGPCAARSEDFLYDEDGMPA